MDSELLNYIESKLQAGTQPENIKKFLLEKGWQESIITEALNSVTNNSSTQVVISGAELSSSKLSTAKKSFFKRKLFKFLLLPLAVLVILFATFLFLPYIFTNLNSVWWPLEMMRQL